MKKAAVFAPGVVQNRSASAASTVEDRDEHRQMAYGQGYRLPVLADDRPQEPQSRRDREGGTFETGSAYQSAGFEGDYHAATNLLKQRMDKSFPDNFHARLGSQTNSMYDYGEDRAGAVDTASTAIAMALRNGATVSQAAEAGAASVGI